jgi:hypothetical protein
MIKGENKVEENNIQAKRKKKGLLIGIIVGIIVTAIGTITVVALRVAKSKEMIVVEAIAKIFNTDSENYMEQVVGVKKTNEQIRNKSYEQGFNIELDKISKILSDSNLFTGTYISGAASNDSKNKSTSLNMEVGIKKDVIFTGVSYFDKEVLMFRSPQLSDEFISWNYRAEDEISKAYIVSEMDIDTEVVQMFQQYIQLMYDIVYPDTKAGKGSTLQDKFFEKIKESPNLLTSFEITELDKKIIRFQGTEKECQGYEIFISKKVFNSYIDAWLEVMREDEQYKNTYMKTINIMQTLVDPYAEEVSTKELEEAWDIYMEQLEEGAESIKETLEDVIIELYVDSKNNPVRFQLEGTFQNPYDEWDEGMDYRLEILYKDGDYLYQNYEASIQLMYEGEYLQLDIEKIESVKDKKMISETTCILFNQEQEYFEGNITTEFDGRTKEFERSLSGTVDSSYIPVTVSLQIEGNYTDIKKGESYTINADEIKLKFNGISFFTLSGSYYIKPLQQNVKQFEGQGIEIMTVTRREWGNFEKDITDNMKELEEKLEEIFQSY